MSRFIYGISSTRLDFDRSFHQVRQIKLIIEANLLYYLLKPNLEPSYISLWYPRSQYLTSRLTLFETRRPRYDRLSPISNTWLRIAGYIPTEQKFIFINQHSSFLIG
ncbi:hypothetical protein ACTXT7_000258 [Hymenolepis weldensis]